MGPSYCHAAVGSSEIEEEREMYGACPLGSHCVQERVEIQEKLTCNLSRMANDDMKPARKSREKAAFNTRTM